MEALPALSSERLILVLIAGGVFSLAGLWMMFKPHPEGSTARIEFLGLKFQSSSAGVLVFLIGAGFFIFGIAAPEQQAVAEGTETQFAGTSENGEEDNAGDDGPNVVQAAAPATPNVTAPSPRVVTFDGEEAENNGSMPRANELPLGTSVVGSVSKGDSDYFTVAVPEGMYGKISFNLNAKNEVWMQVFNDIGGSIRNFGDTYTTEIRYPRYFVQVGLSDAKDWGNKSFYYSLTIAAREE